MTAKNTDPTNLNPADFRGDMRQVVTWHRLLCSAASTLPATGIGPALFWGHVKRGNYGAAKASLDGFIEAQLPVLAEQPTPR